MEKTAVVVGPQAPAAGAPDAVLRQLNTKVKDHINALQKALETPTENSEANLKAMVEKAYREIMSVIALIPTQTAVMAPTTPAAPVATPAPLAAADDAETKAPAFWRKNLDYGSR